MTILVTGGAGYIGSHTCVELLNAGYDVICVDNYYNSVPEVLNRVETITGKTLKKYDAESKKKPSEKVWIFPQKRSILFRLTGGVSVGTEKASEQRNSL